jgi:hypothetical protein
MTPQPGEFALYFRTIPTAAGYRLAGLRVVRVESLTRTRAGTTWATCFVGSPRPGVSPFCHLDARALIPLAWLEEQDGELFTLPENPPANVLAGPGAPAPAKTAAA